MQKLGEQVAAAKAQHDEAAAALEDKRSRLRACDAEIGAITQDRDEAVKRLSDLQVERKKAQHRYKTPGETTHASPPCTTLLYLISMTT